MVYDIMEGNHMRVFENRALRRIFGPRRAEGTGGWRKLHNEEHNNLYSTPSIIKIMGRWAEYVARMGRRMHIGYWWESLKERYH
jgi:GH43 family beta-xylosidase